MEIEQFCVQARSLKNAACVSLIQRAVGHKKIFLFGELLDEPNIQALRSTEFAKALETLELFAYGTYGTYLGNKAV
jgi:COP9 signalosome complex subunit 7